MKMSMWKRGASGAFMEVVPGDVGDAQKEMVQFVQLPDIDRDMKGHSKPMDTKYYILEMKIISLKLSSL